MYVKCDNAIFNSVWPSYAIIMASEISVNTDSDNGYLPDAPSMRALLFIPTTARILKISIPKFCLKFTHMKS